MIVENKAHSHNLKMKNMAFKVWTNISERIERFILGYSYCGVLPNSVNPSIPDQATIFFLQTSECFLHDELVTLL